MVLSQVTPIAPTPRKRKSLFPFTGLLRSAEFQGRGACLAKNVVVENGRLEKMKGPSIVTTRANTDGIKWIGGFKNSSDQHLALQLVESTLSGVYILEAYNLSSGATTYPVLAEANEVSLTGTITFSNGSTAVSASGGAFTTEIAVGDYIYLDGEYSSRVRVLSVTDNDNLVLQSNYGGSGGAGTGMLATKHFTTTSLYLRQLGDEAYLAVDAASNSGYSFDGTTLTAISNFPANPRYLLLDGNRLAVNELFSGEISSTMTNFQAGSGVQQDGAYATSITANGGVEASVGIILMAALGGDAHKVIPNAASDNVSAETKLNSFNYTGQGVKNTNQICMGKDFAYIVNEKGIIEINPFTGQSRILTDEGNIRRRWENYVTDDAIIAYDSSDNKIVALVRDVSQYDTLVVVDLDDRERSVSVQPESYYSCIANINNQLYAGSSIDGSLVKLFSNNSDKNGRALQSRWILEWDALEGVGTEDILKQILIHADVHDNSSITLKLYKNGSIIPVKEQTYTGSAVSITQGSVIATMGFYLSGMGGRNREVSEQDSDVIKKFKKSTRVVTYALEILEESTYDFTVYDVIVEYKSRGRLSREKVQPNVLFT